MSERTDAFPWTEPWLKDEELVADETVTRHFASGAQHVKLDTRLHSDDYVRSRLAPRYRQVDYLCLSDIANWLPTVTGAMAGRRILDYGSGSAPYRSLFGDCEYVCADFGLESTATTVPLGEGGLLNSSESTSFGAVMSFQVLEHVDEPATYLAEARRVLEPGGLLLLTTHGIFPKHSVPVDYWRWTADGLIRTVSNAGFHVESAVRLTTSRRAVAQLAARPAAHWCVPAARRAAQRL